MAGPDKPEFPPLLPPGRHEMSMVDLRQLCVERFPTSQARAPLFAALEQLARDLAAAVGCCELWIDGSFVTDKGEPDDIDLHVKIEQEVFFQLPDHVQDQLTALIDQKNYHPKLHTFLLVVYERGHYHFPLTSEADRDWSQWWCVSREDWLKGLPVVRLGESDVGLRILRRARP